MKNVFIVNKASRTGKGAAVWDALEAHLKELRVNYNVRFTGGPGEATEFAKSATSTGEMVHLFVMGGDGTLNEALNGIVDFEKTFYTPLPAGSANDFVTGIGMTGDAIEIFDRAYNSETYKALDIGTVGDRRFGVSAGIGVDAYVCLQALDSKLKKFLNRFGLGSATYGLLTVGDIFTMPFSEAEMTYWFEGKETTINVNNIIFAAAMIMEVCFPSFDRKGNIKAKSPTAPAMVDRRR